MRVEDRRTTRILSSGIVGGREVVEGIHAATGTATLGDQQTRGGRGQRETLRSWSARLGFDG